MVSPITNNKDDECIPSPSLFKSRLNVMKWRTSFVLMSLPGLAVSMASFEAEAPMTGEVGNDSVEGLLVRYAKVFVLSFHFGNFSKDSSWHQP